MRNPLSGMVDKTCMRTSSLPFVVCVLGLAIAAGLACTRINPDICCVTDLQCHDFGLTDHIPCAAGLACSPTKSVCVPAECQISLDCPASAPLCIDHLCAATCQVDADCNENPGKPFCLKANGQCVGCLDASSCPPDKAFCDAESHACRGCLSDDQCSSGVCVEADGTCADRAAVLLVSSNGTDSGDCSTAPCASISYALGKVTDTRTIIRLNGGVLADAPTIHFNRAVVIDGDHTQINTPTNGPTFAFDNLVSGVVTIEGVRFTTPGAARPAVSVSAGNVIRLHDVGVTGSILESQGTLNVSLLSAASTTLDCTSGTLSMVQSTLNGSTIDAMNCAVTLVQNQFSFDATAVTSRGGLVTIENNIFVALSEFTDAVVVGANAPNSTLAFNTFVNTATLVQSPVAVTCDSTDVVTSNVFAYNSTHPLSDGCAARASLFDLVGSSEAGSNVTGDPATFFMDRAGGDFHLAARSPAIGIGELGIVNVDLRGGSRPVPTGSQPDAGAFEAP